jgi:hypothetical protein
MVLYVIARAGLAYLYSSREDIRHFFSDLVDRLMLVGKQIKDLMISKGLYIHPPIIPVPDKIDFVKKQNYLAGFFGDIRPLSVIEAYQLFFNAKQNAIGKALLMGFSQTARTKEIKQYFIQGRDLSNKYLGDINRILLNENIDIAPSYDGEVTASTEGPFSERLMLLHTSVLISAGLQNIGMALSLSPRHDLAAMYTKMITEIESLANAGAKLLIENGWMEEPPLAPDRDALGKTNQNNLAKDKLH